MILSGGGAKNSTLVAILTSKSRRWDCVSDSPTSLACPQRRKRPWLCSPGARNLAPAARPTFLRQPERSARRCLVRFHIHRFVRPPVYTADLRLHAPRNQRWRAQAHQDGPTSKVVRGSGIRAGQDLHPERQCGFQGRKVLHAIRLSKQIEERIFRTLGFRFPVVSRTVDEMSKTIASNPFLKQRGIDPEKLHVMFLSEAPTPVALKKLADVTKAPPISSTASDEEIYFHLPNGVSQSVLMKIPVDRILAVVTTTRNLRTVNSLHEMCKECR